MTPKGLTAARDRLVRATVCAGGTETSYDRMGQGPTLLLLLGPLLLEESTRQALAANFCVLQPDTVSLSALVGPAVADDSPFRQWLQAFLAGLGVEEAQVATTRRYVDELEACRLASPDVISRVTVVNQQADLLALCPQPRAITEADGGH